MLLEKCLLEIHNPSGFVGSKINGVTVTAEMAEGVLLALDYVIKKRGDMGGIIEVETCVDLSVIHPDIWGTLDIAIFKKGKSLLVSDFKYGFSKVEVRENKQLLTYALGAALKNNWDFDEVELVIIQPRAPHQDGPIRSWTITRDYLLAWAPILGEAARLTEKSDAPLFLGDHCQYCPAKGICPKQNEIVERSLLISTKEKTITLPSLETLTDVQIAKIVEHQSQIEDFLAEVKRLALHRLKSGEKIEGLKLVAGRGSRIWSNEADAEVYLWQNLQDMAFTRKLLSVAQAEQVLPKPTLEHLWVKIDGSETVTHVSDKRKEIENIKTKLVLNNKTKGE